MEKAVLVNAAENPAAFQNMFNLYAHELSLYNTWLGTKLDENGNYLANIVKSYIEDDGYKSYCITENSRPIGLAVFSSELDDGVWYHDVEELFLINTERHKGAAERLCKEFWSSCRGIGTLHVLSENENAIRFWEKLLTECKYNFTKTSEDAMVVYRFPLD